MYYKQRSFRWAELSFGRDVSRSIGRGICTYKQVYTDTDTYMYLHIHVTYAVMRSTLSDKRYKSGLEPKYKDLNKLWKGLDSIQ